jgi:hypothetical protein
VTDSSARGLSLAIHPVVGVPRRRCAAGAQDVATPLESCGFDDRREAIFKVDKPARRLGAPGRGEKEKVSATKSGRFASCPFLVADTLFSSDDWETDRSYLHMRAR